MIAENMVTASKVKQERRVIEPDMSQPLRRAFALDVLEGLSQRPKRIPSVYLYDKKGAELFQRITALEAYYLTQCEQEILTVSKEEIYRSLPRQSFNLIELGSGDGRKTILLIMDFHSDKSGSSTSWSRGEIQYRFPSRRGV
jgi:uncharacterized SAM-dependent methyltransferase